MNVNKITNEDRTAVLKFYAAMKGHSLNELAEVIGVSGKTFASRLNTWNWMVTEMVMIHNFLNLDYAVFKELFALAG